ncbi:MAG: PKD domain-containing protein [Halobacteriota archaeon]
MKRREVLLRCGNRLLCRGKRQDKGYCAELWKREQGVGGTGHDELRCLPVPRGLTYTPGADESGQRVVRITVSDNSPLSRDTFERRLVEVLSEVENLPPVADPDGPYIGTEGVAIAFNGSGSYDQDGDIASYAWDFGDGNTSSEERPTHTYAQNGTYTITLNVTDDDGATDINTTTATIDDTESTADFFGIPTSGLKQLTVNFTDNSTSYDGFTTWEWDFGDGGNSSDQNPTHLYANAGLYNVTLTAYEADGDSDTETKEDYIIVTEENQPPVADPNGPYTDKEGVAIAFNGSGSYDPDGDIASYAWDFGDGNTSSEESPTHTYAQNGTYTVSLNVTDDDGATDINTTTATIDDTEPTADFFGIPTSGLKPLTVNFTDNSTTYDGFTTWEWDFGDGNTSSEQDPTHLYANAGFYNVTLTVYEADGNNDTETKIGYITVTEVNQPPVADPNGPYIGTEGVEIAFNGSGSYDPDGGIASYAWDFGDGNTSSEQHPTHLYANAGFYNVTLRVYDGDGDSDSEIKIEYINVTEFMDLQAEINKELDALITNVSDTDMPNIIKRRLVDKLEYAKALKDNAKEECEAGNFDGATKKLGVVKNQLESFASMVEITRRISAADKASFLADATAIIGNIGELIGYIETEHSC